MFKELENLIRNYYEKPTGAIHLHEPIFNGNEKKYTENCITSTFVSSVGQYVTDFGKALENYTQAKYAVPIVNGTAALHLSLIISGVEMNDEVITQPLTFIATANAISYCKANPLFIDVERESLGLCPNKLEDFLKKHTTFKNGFTYNKETGRRIAACIPMHSFGLVSEIDRIIEICKAFNIKVIEDSAESLGSFVGDVHTGLKGDVGILSFNGNKIITAGGGGAIITNDDILAKKAHHLSTQAKVPHAYRFIHDEIGYNYRMPNLNAALVLAQLEQIEDFLSSKRTLHNLYSDFFSETEYELINERSGTRSNYWLNVVLAKDEAGKVDLIEKMRELNIHFRQAWDLIPTLKMYKKAYIYDITVAEEMEKKIVNITSSAKA